MITGLQVSAILAKLKPGVRWYDWADCCHAHGSLRRMPYRNERFKFIDNPAAKPGQLVRSVVPSEEYPDNIVGFAACQWNQTSADAYIDGVYCGAYTNFGLQAWNEQSNAAQTGTVIDRATQLLQRGGYDQHPELCADHAGSLLPMHGG